MRIWAATRDMDKIIKEVVMDFPAAHSEDEWNAVLGDICHELDLSRPVLLKKHLNEHIPSHGVFTKRLYGRRGFFQVHASAFPGKEEKVIFARNFPWNAFT